MRKKARPQRARKKRRVESGEDPWPAGVSAWDLTKEWVGSVRSKDVPDAADLREAMESWNPDRRD